jgi:hypothetical protein
VQVPPEAALRAEPAAAVPEESATEVLAQELQI